MSFFICSKSSKTSMPNPVAITSIAFKVGLACPFSILLNQPHQLHTRFHRIHLNHLLRQQLYSSRSEHSRWKLLCISDSALRAYFGHGGFNRCDWLDHTVYRQHQGHFGWAGRCQLCGRGRYSQHGHSQSHRQRLQRIKHTNLYSTITFSNRYDWGTDPSFD